MSSTDKTGEKLLASIRKTKAGGKPTETTSGGSGAAGRAAPAKKAAVRKKAGATKAAAKSAARPAADAYQSARRVWPD